MNVWDLTGLGWDGMDGIRKGKRGGLFLGEGFEPECLVVLRCFLEFSEGVGWKPC